MHIPQCEQLGALCTPYAWPRSVALPLVAALSAVPLAGCLECKEAPTATISALDGGAGVGRLDTTLSVSPEGHAFETDLPNTMCRSSSTPDIKRVAWDLDGDGTYEVSSFDDQSVHFDTVGDHVVHVEVVDSKGKKGHESLTLQVFDPADAQAILARVYLDVFYNYSDDLSCAEGICVDLGASVQHLALDALTLRDTATGEALFREEHVDLASGLFKRCAPFGAGRGAGGNFSVDVQLGSATRTIPAVASGAPPLCPKG